MPEPSIKDSNQLSQPKEPSNDRNLINAGHTNEVHEPKMPDYEHVSDKLSEGEEMKQEVLVDDSECGDPSKREDTKSARSTDEHSDN